MNAKNQAWLPVEFIKVGPHHLVKLVDANKLDLSFGFLSASLMLVEKKGHSIRVVSLEKWLEKATFVEESTQEQPGFIFHVARCGSTLLCQNLKNTGRFIVLGEPIFFHDIYKNDDNIPSEQRSAIVTQTLMSWRIWSGQQEKTLLLKLSSSLNLYREQIQKDFPESKVLFLYREPIAVLESMTRKVPGYLSEINNQELELINRAVAVYKTSLMTIPITLNENFASIDYTMLESHFEKIVCYFSRTPHLNSQTLLWSKEWSAKNKSSSNKTYIPQPKQNLQNFYNKHRSIIDPVFPYYKGINPIPPK